eukprot:SAG31_NODE_4990_length_2816_cov_3.224880_2_plen_86_part_00
MQVWRRAHLACFDSFDLNGDGVLSARELDLVFRQLGMTPTEEDVRELLHAYDIDDSGSLDKAEFLEMVRASPCSSAAHTSVVPER